MYDLIIIGGGPAGLTAALYALRANKKVLVLEAKDYGGKIVRANNIENYPGIASISGYEFATNLYNQVKNLGMEFKKETVIRITEDKKVFTHGNSYEAKAIIIATGTDSRKLNIDKETDFIGKGISYCATCDGNFFRNKDVAVVGGGDTALEDAIYLSNIANKVYVIHRNNTFSGNSRYLDELNTKNNVEFIFNSNILNLNGNNKLESIDIKNNDGNIKNINISGLFIAIGEEPQNNIFKGLIDMDDNGFILSKDDVHTNIEGIYVAGDVRKKELRQLTTAVGDGSLAASIAIKEMK